MPWQQSYKEKWGFTDFHFDLLCFAGCSLRSFSKLGSHLIFKWCCQPWEATDYKVPLWAADCKPIFSLMFVRRGLEEPSPLSVPGLWWEHVGMQSTVAPFFPFFLPSPPNNGLLLLLQCYVFTYLQKSEMNELDWKMLAAKFYNNHKVTWEGKEVVHEWDKMLGQEEEKGEGTSRTLAKLRVSDLPFKNCILLSLAFMK